MTEAELRRLFDVWRVRLGLDRWRIELEVGGVDDDTSIMEVSRSTIYERGRVHVSPWALEGGPPAPAGLLEPNPTDEALEASLVHELLHCLTRDLRAVTRFDLEGLLHRDVHSILEAAATRAEERLVDELAEALVRAFGPAA